MYPVQMLMMTIKLSRSDNKTDGVVETQEK